MKKYDENVPNPKDGKNHKKKVFPLPQTLKNEQLVILEILLKDIQSFKLDVKFLGLIFEKKSVLIYIYINRDYRS